MSAQMKNLLVYCGVAVANMLAIATAAALAAGTLPGFREAEFLAPAVPSLVALVALLAPIPTAWLASNRPRIGSEGLSEQVNALKAQGVPKDRMVVLSEAEAASVLATPSSARPFTPEQLRQVLDGLETRMRSTPAPGAPPVLFGSRTGER
jgi:hypothetical protein